MATLVLGAIALVAVVLSFALVALTLVRALPNTEDRRPAAESTTMSYDEPSAAAHTISRVTRELAELSTLRERGVLTDKEFEAQKADCLNARPELPRRTT